MSWTRPEACPFCRSANVGCCDVVGPSYFFRCCDCFAFGPSGDTPEDAARLWGAAWSVVGAGAPRDAPK